MSYIAPKDFSQDPEILAQVTKVMSGELDLSWMESIRERITARPTQARRGLTLDDINLGSYGPDEMPEIIRHNFSMAPRGAILLWSDRAASIFEEAKSRHWAPARSIDWKALDDHDYSDNEQRALQQLYTSLTSIGLITADVPSRWVWLMNQEFHEVKYLMCAQMIDGTRIAEVSRKRALYGVGALGVDCQPLGELLKMVFESGTYPCASLSLNLVLCPFTQMLARHLEFVSRNAADTQISTLVAQDATRFIAYGVDHVRGVVGTRESERETLNGHLDLVENGLVGVLGAREIVEPLILLSGGLDPVARTYARLVDEHFARCESAGLGDRRQRSPLPAFLQLIRD
ncbi:MAG: hypothetical protein JRG76_10095 [Deltaproteobacteria bacterium]|nr:hypothetical protein [Deltaproteobacteria bacterium]